MDEPDYLDLRARLRRQLPTKHEHTDHGLHIAELDRAAIAAEREEAAHRASWNEARDKAAGAVQSVSETNHSGMGSHYTTGFTQACHDCFAAIRALEPEPPR